MIAVSIDDSDLVETLAGLGDAVRAALQDATGALADQLLSAAVALLPDGPLANSLASTITADDTGVRAAIGSDLPYAAVQNYGFAGTEDVRESLRLQSVAFGRPMTPREVLVRAHGRRMDIPGKAYLTGPLDAMQDDIAAGYESAVDEALGS